MLRRSLRLILPGVAKMAGVRQFPSDITAFFVTTVREELDRRSMTAYEKLDVMQLLLKMRNARKEVAATKDADFEFPVSDELLAAQAFVFVLTGFDSPINTMTFCLYELAHNPDIQSRIRQEAQKALAEHTEPSAIYEAFGNMRYLEMVLSETMRKHPVTGILLRECSKPCTLPGTSVVLEPGTPVFIQTYGLHHDPKYFPEPDKFLPDRFAEGVKNSVRPFTYLPFGGGPRVCIAQRFAYLQMKVMLAELLLAFEVKTCPQTVPSLKLDPRAFSKRPKDPVLLQFNPLPA